MRSRLKLKKYFQQNPKKYSKRNPIPPQSVIAVRKDNPGPYAGLLNQTLRIGYYSIQDGLNMIWIVYPSGEYGETTNHQHINRYFTVVSASDETDFYGVNRPFLQPLV